MRRTPRSRSLLHTAAVAVLVVGMAACDSGGANSGSAVSTTSTTRTRRHRRATTTTSASSTPSTSATTLPDTTVPPTPSTTLPVGGAGTCGAAAGPISAAVLGGDLGAVPLASYDVSDCRQSTSQPIWAAVTLRAKPSQTVAPLTVVLERLGSIWTVHSYASGPTGCDTPAPVPSELRLGC